MAAGRDRCGREARARLLGAGCGRVRHGQEQPEAARAKGGCALKLSDDALRELDVFHATDVPAWLDENGFTTALYVESGEEWADTTARYREAFGELDAKQAEKLYVIRVPSKERGAAAARLRKIREAARRVQR